LNSASSVPPPCRRSSRSASSSARTATASSTPRRRSAATRMPTSTSARWPSAAWRSPLPSASTGAPGSAMLLELRGPGSWERSLGSLLACCCATSRAPASLTCRSGCDGCRRFRFWHHVPSISSLFCVAFVCVSGMVAGFSCTFSLKPRWSSSVPQPDPATGEQCFSTVVYLQCFSKQYSKLLQHRYCLSVL
jgi:hypothetical protein